jgi:transposase-like protein
MKVSYATHRFPPEIIQQAIWLSLRFTLRFRDVEHLLAERGITLSYETVRRWVNHFGSMISADLRKRRPRPDTTWRLDEVYLKIDGRMVYLWRAVDAEGEVLDVLVQSKRTHRHSRRIGRRVLSPADHGERHDQTERRRLKRSDIAEIADLQHQGAILRYRALRRTPVDGPKSNDYS